MLDTFEQEHRYNDHGERERFTMPLPPNAAPSGLWTKWLAQRFDAMGNLIAIDRLDANGANPIPLVTASCRAAGRPDVRTILTPSVTIARAYTYDERTSLLRRVEVTANGRVVAGSAIDHDGLQTSEARLLGIASNELATRYAYDDRSRLLASVFGSRANVDPTQPIAGRALEGLNPADFRTLQERIPAAAHDPAISTTFDEATGHKIAKVTRGPDVRPFVHGGAERIDDGRFVYTYDAKGRLIHAMEKATVPPFRRVTYLYSGTGRMIGRRAEYTTIGVPAESDWRLEDRGPILAADGLPADTTFAWDLISDRLLAVYRAGATGDPIRQIIHGDAAYDDPLITTTIDPASGAPTTVYPIFDEAAAGTLQAVLNASGEIVARNLPNDPYGADDRALAGAAVDRIAIRAAKDASGALTSLEAT